MITDLNITYTGCSTTCNGEEIKPGMRLREILDILIGNCSEGGSATWGDIIGNIEDQTDLVQFIQDNISVTNWGSILGDITDQEDLVQFVQENGFGEDKIGSNLHLDGDGKVSLGVDGYPDDAVILLNSTEDPSAQFLLSENQVDLVKLVKDSGGQVIGFFGFSITSNDILISGRGEGQNLRLENSDGRVIINVGGGGDVDISSSNSAPDVFAPGTVNIRADTSLRVRTQSSGVNKLLVDTNVKINPSAEYPDGMPSSPSDNVLPTIGYVRDTLISDAITPLVQQIADLEARVQALEDATP